MSYFLIMILLKTRLSIAIRGEKGIGFDLHIQLFVSTAQGPRDNNQM